MYAIKHEKKVTQSQSNNKKLATNMFLFSLMHFVPKVFSFFLVPVYTAYLSTEEYGISDLVLNTANLLLPIFSLSINNAVLRFTIENKDDMRPFNIGMLHSFGSSLLLAIGLYVASFITEIDAGYLIFIFIIYTSSAVADILLGYVRAQEEMRLITFCGIVSSICCLLCNILFIVVLEMGAYGFIASNAIGNIIYVVVIAISFRKKRVFNLYCIKGQKTLVREMYNYSFPMVISGITWWVYASSDRYFVTGMCGTAENGIYSVAYKIPNMLQVLENIFSQAWLFSIYDLYKTEEGKKYITKVYYMFSYVMCIGASGLITGNLLLAKILYSKEFYVAWRYIPPLLISIAVTAVGTVMGQVLTAHKETKFPAKVALLAAALNCIMNYYFIRITNDALGAAIATALTAVVSTSINTWKAVKIGSINIDFRRYIIMLILLVIESIALIGYQNYIICGLLTLIMALLNMDHNRWVINKLFIMIRRL